MSALKAFVKSRPGLKRILLAVTRTIAPLFAGFRPLALLKYPGFLGDLRRFRALGGNAAMGDLYPCLFDRTATSGIDAQYFHQAIWAFRAIQERRPASHVDVASEVNFVGLLTCLVPVTFVDIRPLELDIPNYKGLRGSLTALPFPDTSVESLSCLHVIEHVGLGRYGDPLDPLGPEKACAQIARVLAPGGFAYISVPIGRPRVAFNGLRVFSAPEVVRMFAGLRLAGMGMVDARGEFHPQVTPDTADIHESGTGADFGLGLFMFRKPEGAATS